MTPNKKPVVLYFGIHNGKPVNQVPLSYLAYVYGSYTKTGKQVEGEMRRRGFKDSDFLLAKKRYPVRGKYPQKQKVVSQSPIASHRPKKKKKKTKPFYGTPIELPLPVATTRCSPESMSTFRLKQICGESGGTDKPVEEELRTRGFNTRELIDVERQHQQKKWLKERKKASTVTRKKKQSIRNASHRRHRFRKKERRRQEQIDKAARLKDGVVIVGDNFDPSAADGSCPF